MNPPPSHPNGSTPNVGMHPGASESTSEPMKTRGNAATNLLPRRKNIRAEFHDYSDGDYFITMCTRNRCHYFGEIYDGEMHFSALGEFAHMALENLASHYGYAEVSSFVVMPNHVHAIISIGAFRLKANEIMPQIRTALSVVVGGYKQAVTMFARRHSIEFGWQSRYNDHIIRGAHDGNLITNYIDNNVARWTQDCFNK